jgi:hypothetical protein
MRIMKDFMGKMVWRNEIEIISEGKMFRDN